MSIHPRQSSWFDQAGFTCCASQARAFLSPGVDSRVAHGILFPVDRCVHVAVVRGLARRARPLPHAQRQDFHSVAALAASLRAGVERSRTVNTDPFKSDLYSSCLRNSDQPTSWMVAVLHHSFHVQVLDKDLRVVFADLGRELVKEISAHIGNAPVTTRQTQTGFLAIVRTSPLAGMGAGEAAQPF